MKEVIDQEVCLLKLSEFQQRIHRTSIHSFAIDIFVSNFLVLSNVRRQNNVSESANNILLHLLHDPSDVGNYLGFSSFYWQPQSLTTMLVYLFITILLSSL